MTPEAQLAALRDLARGLITALKGVDSCRIGLCDSCRVAVREAIEVGELMLEELKA